MLKDVTLGLEKIRVAAFIMTYERITHLKDTIERILRQSLSPLKILIVDNSHSNAVQETIEGLGDSRLSYFRVGYNAGPAGAAMRGLEILAKEGFDWIYWGDDDDPPYYTDLFERQIKLGCSDDKIGIVGTVGGGFNRFTGSTFNFKNKELKKIVDADYVTGGRQMIVNRKVVESGVLPIEKIFFGFEELEFCLRARDKGYRIVFDGDRVKELRYEIGKTDPNYKWKGKSFGKKEVVNRQYYSLRNMLYILLSRRHLIAYSYLMAKTAVKIVWSLKYGFEYFSSFSKSQMLAICHHLTGRYGKYDAAH